MLRRLLPWLLLSPFAVHAFEAVDVLHPTGSGQYLAYPADPIQPYELWAQFGMMYDTNILRRTTGNNDETVARASVGGRWDQRVVGRQGLHVVGQIDGFLYNKFSDLDNIGYSGLGEWRWELGNQLAGTLGYGRRHYQTDLGERQAAIEHYTDMLRLNPGDNQGIRYVLAHCLLQAGEDEALGRLLDQFKDDDMAEWSYTRALWRFRRDGANAAAKSALNKALKANRFVPAYLLGKKKLPRQLPGYIGFGDENEAVSYAVEGIDDWRATPGALEWLASVV